jgi:hypothetical protein
MERNMEKDNSHILIKMFIVDGTDMVKNMEKELIFTM